MITYSCPHNGIIEAVERAGHSLWSSNGVFYSDNDVAVQAIIDGFDHLSYVIGMKKREIDEELDSRVYGNMTDVERRMEALRASIVLENRGGNMSPVQQARSNKATTRQQAIQPLFDAADTARYALESETDWTVVFAFDAKLDVGWP